MSKPEYSSRVFDSNPKAPTKRGRSSGVSNASTSDFSGLSALAEQDFIGLGIAMTIAVPVLAYHVVKLSYEGLKVAANWVGNKFKPKSREKNLEQEKPLVKEKLPYTKGHAGVDQHLAQKQSINNPFVNNVKKRALLYCKSHNLTVPRTHNQTKQGKGSSMSLS